MSTSDGSTGPEVLLFTDGACGGNPGPGGWAFILKHPKTGKVKEVSGYEPDTTNNRMELMAVIQGLSALTKHDVYVEVLTDSEYVRKGLDEWMAGWKKNGWKRKEKGKLVPLKNDDLWKQLDVLTALHPNMKLTRVAGHSGHPENDRCDELAVAAYRNA
jgi:ribonuclease HI